MFSLNVVDPGLVLGFEHKPIQAADEAPFFDIYFQLVLEVSHVCKGVNNDSEDQVQQEDHDDAKVRQVKNIPNPILTRIFVQSHLF